STSIFGDRAMGGAIGLFSRPAARHHLTGSYEGGNRDTHEVSTGFSETWNRFAISGYGRAFTTDGYFLIPKPQRGLADRLAGVRFVAGDARVDHHASIGDFFFKMDVLAEDRQNGTSLQHNSTSFGNLSLRYARQFTADSFSLLGFHTREGFHSSFSALTADRNRETLSYLQTVPSEAVGGAAMWQHHRSTWNVLGGADVYRVEGTSTGHLVPTGERVGGGTQLQHGIFGQADVKLGPARFFAGLRHSFTGQDSTFLSPSAGFSAGRGRLRARGSVYRSFRAPTLNELFREFRAGTT